MTQLSPAARSALRNLVHFVSNHETADGELTPETCAGFKVSATPEEPVEDFLHAELLWNGLVDHSFTTTVWVTSRGVTSFLRAAAAGLHQKDAEFEADKRADWASD